MLKFTPKTNSLWLVLTITCIVVACSPSAMLDSAEASVTTNEHTSVSLAVRTIAANNQCALGDDAFASLINSNSTLDQWWAKIHRQQLLATRTAPPTVDFRRFVAIIIFMGQQRTGGYGLSVAEQPLTIELQRATLLVDWQIPKLGMMQAQALTSPCVLVQIPRANYQTLAIVDQDGKKRFELTVGP